jgi:hypothetical protein
MKRTQPSLLFFLLAATFVCLLTSPHEVIGQSAKRSIANGDWFDPNVWNPAGVPSALTPTDSLIIETNITFANPVDARNVAREAFIVRAGASLVGTTISDTLVLGIVDYLLNDGLVSNQSVLGIGGINSFTRNRGQFVSKQLNISDVFLHDGGIDADLLNISGSFTGSSGSVILADTFIPSENYINDAGGVVSVSGLLVIGGFVTNNGDISTVDFVNSGNLTGVSGKLCISGCFTNTDTITGTIDICDASPQGFCDFDAGYIDGTVTYCASGACATVGSDEATPNTSLARIYPNPSEGRFTLAATDIEGDLTIYASSGKRILLQKVVAGLTAIDLTMLPSGIYLAKVEDGTMVQVIKLIVR